MTVYHVDGELVPGGEATVSVRDRGFMYGDAAFETLRVYGGVPFRWDDHYDRLMQTATTLGFAEAVPSAENLRSRIEETLAANGFSDTYVRLSVTRGVQPGKLTPDSAVDPTVVVIVDTLPRGGVEGSRVWDEPAHVAVVDTRRIPNEAIPAHAKTHNYLNGILARLDLSSDVDEALLLTTDEILTEGATSNFVAVCNGQLRTPTTALPVLPGITRKVVLECAREAGIPVETGRYGTELLDRADELFVTNSTWEIRPVTQVGDHELSVGPVTAELQNHFDERVEACYRSD